MADDVQVRFRADLDEINVKLSALASKFDGVQGHADKAAKGVSSSFKETESQLSNTFRNIAAGIGAAFSVAAVINFSKTAVLAFAEVQKVETQLRQSLGKSAAAFGNLVKQAERLQKTLGIDAEVIKKQQTFLANQNRTTEQIEKTIEAAVQLSAVTGEDLQSAVQKLDATFEGTIGRLGKLDGRFNELTKEQLANGEAIDLINEKYKGFAESTIETTDTQLKIFKETVGDFVEDIGSGITAIINQAAAAGNIFLEVVRRITGSKGEVEQAGKDTGEEYFKGVESAISGADRKSFETIAKQLEDNAKESVDRVAKVVVGFRERAQKAQTVEERRLNNETANLIERDALHNEEVRLERVREIIEKERIKKKRLFDQQSQDEIDAGKKAADEQAKRIKERQIDYINSLKIIDPTKQQQPDIRTTPPFPGALTIEQIDYIKEYQLNAIREYVDAAASLIGNVFDFSSAQNDAALDNIQERKDFQNEAFDEEAAALEKKNERGAISDREYQRQKDILNEKRKASDKKLAEEESKLKTKQAQTEKTRAIFETIINTAIAISKVLSNPLLVALVAAAGAVQLATIVATPIPKFKKGEKFVDSATAPRGDDTILSWLDRGERVSSAENNKKHWDKYEAIESGNFNKYVEKFYVTPQLAAAKKEFERSKNEGFAKNVAESILYNSPGWNYYDADRLRKKGMEINNTKELAKEIALIINDSPRYFGKLYN